MQAGGVMPQMKTKAPMVDPNGAFTKVQERTLGKYILPTAKHGTKITKAKNGKSFPDLNKDGKVTKADILKGRGVIAKKGAKVKASGMKKCRYGCK